MLLRTKVVQGKRTAMEEIIKYLLMGGGVGVLVTLLTIKSQVRQSSAAATAADLTNVEKALDMITRHRIEPLQREINELRNEVAKLQSAVCSAFSCERAGDCPVIDELQDNEESSEGELPGQHVDERWPQDDKRQQYFYPHLGDRVL